MDHHNHGVNTSDPLYWIIFVPLFIIMNAVGVAAWLGDHIDLIDLPAHNVKYLPDWETLIPAVIVAACVATVSFLTNQTLKLIWRRIFPKKT